jgi:hypothetical protein
MCPCKLVLLPHGRNRYGVMVYRSGRVYQCATLDQARRRAVRVINAAHRVEGA